LKFFDMHTHSHWSFDGRESIESLCEAALAKGLAGIAVTDHNDIDCVVKGIYPPYEAEKYAEELAAVKKRYAGRLRVIMGVELGQCHLEPIKSRELVETFGYEYVLGALHNLQDVPDFSFMKYESMPQGLLGELFDRALQETKLLAGEPYLSALAHLTYPLRYMRLAGRKLDITRYYDKISEVYDVLIARGIPLEINTSGLRNALGMTLPEEELVRFWRECGGRLVVLGSDAHRAHDVGAGLEYAYEMTQRIGGLEIFEPDTI